MGKQADMKICRLSSTGCVPRDVHPRSMACQSRVQTVHPLLAAASSHDLGLLLLCLQTPPNPPCELRICR